jgi:ABC-type uncharacterized transport system ATPase subunit
MRQISKTYAGVRANDSIDLSIRKGSIHALAGENGAGKSTLMKILFGLEEADENNETEAGVFLSGKKVKFKSPLDAIEVGIGMVQQHFAQAEALSALDNIILGSEPVSHGVIDRVKAEVILSKLAGKSLNVPWSKNISDLTVGFHQRVEILKLLFRKAQILILDEPTAVLTPQEVETFFELLRQLRTEGKTIILITHKLKEVLSLCDEVTILRHGKVTGAMTIPGPTEKDLMKAMIGREIAPLQKPEFQVGKTVIEGKNLSVKYGDRGDLKGLHFRIRAGEILGIAGVEGNGQEALVEAILGLCKQDGKLFYRGHILDQSTAKRRNEFNFGLISEDRQAQSIWMDASIAENCAIGFTTKLSRLGFLSKRRMNQFAQEILAPYAVKMRSMNQPISDLSGGNQQKIVVAREVSARKPDFLIASHPTRGVDVGAIELIHQQILNLQKKGSAILLISSELEELAQLSDRILVLFEGQGVREFAGPKFDLNEIGKAMTGAHE